MIEDRSEDESKCKRKKSKKTEDKDKKSRRSNNKSSIRKSTKERTPKSKENDTAYALLKEQSKILDIMGSSPLIVSTVTPKAKKNLSSKGKDSDFKKKTKIKNALKKKRGTPKSIPVKNEDIKDTKILSEKSMTSLTISSMGDIGLDQAVASSVINEGEPIGNGGEDKVKKVQTKNENNEIRVSEKKKIKEKQEREPKHSLKILKKKVEKVDILLSELDISTDKYKKLSKKRAEYAKQLERLGVIGDHSNDDNHGESATKTENGNLEIELNHDEGGAIDGRYGFIGLNDSKGSDDRGENSPIDNIDGTPDWSKSSQAKADKEKRRQSSLGRHAERKKSMRETKKNKSIKTRTRGFRETRMDEDFSVPVFKKSKDEKKFLKGSLENDFVFQNLEPNSFKMFIDAFEEVEYQRGINVIKQGDFGDYFYVVAEGKVKFYVHGKRVGTGQRGRSFGEAALLYTAPRSATVTASETPTILYRVDQKTFKFITQNSAKELRQQKLELLRAVDFLSDLLYDDLQRLCDLMVPRSIAKGKYLYRKDADADAFYILQSGEMTATDIIVEDSIFEDIVIQPGDYFGQNALARDAPRENSVVALEDSSVYGIDRGTFDKVLGSFYNVILKTNDRQLLVSLSSLFRWNIGNHSFDMRRLLLPSGSHRCH
jgi:cAMP-dependent protein kinase regulator